VAAAFDDPRFAPLGKEEYPRLEYEISILSLVQPIDPEDVEVGKHGLVITYGGRRGLLLPQVAVEHGWDREKFLEQTCVKAGLPTDAWEHGAKIEAFSAEIFNDNDTK
jgi:AmmeMemoRadiSam system protein A